jgi:hypothetical protein
MDEKHPVEKKRERVEGGWLILEYSNNPIIRIDGRALDAVVARGDTIDLVVNEMPVSLRVKGGADHAQSIAAQLIAVGRNSPIVSEAEYQHAQTRLRRILAGEMPEPFVFLGEYPVLTGDAVPTEERVLLVGVRAVMFVTQWSWATKVALWRLMLGEFRQDWHFCRLRRHDTRNHRIV